MLDPKRSQFDLWELQVHRATCARRRGVMTIISVDRQRAEAGGQGHYSVTVREAAPLNQALTNIGLFVESNVASL
jgi:hypothetical protein